MVSFMLVKQDDVRMHVCGLTRPHSGLYNFRDGCFIRLSDVEVGRNHTIIVNVIVVQTQKARHAKKCLKFLKYLKNIFKNIFKNI
jgi:hypothetical protein